MIKAAFYLSIVLVLLHLAHAALPCASNPCQNGGTCSDGGGDTFTCACAQGYSGTLCASSCVQTNTNGAAAWVQVEASDLVSDNAPQGVHVYPDGSVLKIGRVILSPSQASTIVFGGACPSVNTQIYGASTRAVVLTKHDSCTGHCLWARVFGVPNMEALGVTVDSANNIIATMKSECRVDFNNVTVANLTLFLNTTGANSVPCNLLNIVPLLVKLNPDATSVSWYYTAAADTLASGSLGHVGVDSSDNVYWMFDTSTMSPGFYLRPNSSSNSLRISTVWSNNNAGDCAVVKLTPAGAFLWASVVGTSNHPFNSPACRSLSVLFTGQKLAIGSSSPMESVETLQPCGRRDDQEADLTGALRVTILNAADGTCITTKRFGGAVSDREESPAMHLPQSAQLDPDGLSVYVWGITVNDLTHSYGFMHFPPLPALHPPGRLVFMWVAKLDITRKLTGVWQRMLTWAPIGFEPDVIDELLIENLDPAPVAQRTMAVDGRYGVTIAANFFFFTAVCLENVAVCDYTTAIPFFGNRPRVDTWYVGVLKFDTITGNPLWMHRYVTNYTDVTLNRIVWPTVAHNSHTGYGQLAVAGNGQPFDYGYTYQFDDQYAVPGTSLAAPFSWGTKLYDTDSTVSATPVTFTACDSSPCHNGDACGPAGYPGSSYQCTCASGSAGSGCGCLDSTANANGTATWAKFQTTTLDESANVFPKSVFIHTDGSTYTSGNFPYQSPGKIVGFGGNCGNVTIRTAVDSGNAAFIAKYACNGTCLWVRVYRVLNEPSTFMSLNAMSIKVDPRDSAVVVSFYLPCLVSVLSNLTIANHTFVPGDLPCGTPGDDVLPVAVLARFNQDATALVWYRIVTPHADDAYFGAVAGDMSIDSGSNVYWWVDTYTAEPGFYLLPNSTENPIRISESWTSSTMFRPVVFKFSFDGVYQWHRTIGPAADVQFNSRRMAASSDGKLVAMSYVITNPQASLTYMPCNTQLRGPVNNVGGTVFVTTLDDTGTCVATAPMNNASSTSLVQASYDTDGLGVDAAHNVYLWMTGAPTGLPDRIPVSIPPLAETVYNGSSAYILVKLRADLTGVWARALAGNSIEANLQGNSLAVDGRYGLLATGYIGSFGGLCYASNATYCAATDAVPGLGPTVNQSNVHFIAKFNTVSGNLQWARAYIIYDGLDKTNGKQTSPGPVSSYGLDGYGLFAVAGTTVFPSDNSGPTPVRGMYDFGSVTPSFYESSDLILTAYTIRVSDAGYGASPNAFVFDPCLSVPCINGGTCEAANYPRLDSYRCICPAGYGGLTCGGPCDVNTCANGGNCVPIGQFEFTCTCAGGFSGPTCGASINECLSSPCLQGGNCTDTVNGYTCSCPCGYDGNQCQSGLGCQNGGTCVDIVSDICACADGYSGSVCQTNINECGSSPCTNGGTCTDGVNRYSCTCAPGYSGPDCQTNINECASSPCHNGGTCVDAVNRFSCTCAAGYSGPACNTDINECASTPCLNGGTCTDALNRFTCTCAPGYSGPSCNTNVNECASTPCMNGGTCVDTVNGFSCTCPLTHNGRICQTALQACLSFPCQHGGTCNEGGSFYTCTCAPGYQGLECQTDIDECGSSPCQNGGTCVDTLNRYTCTCAAGYSGPVCQSNINECTSTPCRNGGTCTDAVNRYTCTCAPGYSGPACNTNINECASGPCRNSGSCVDAVNRYTCVCYPGTSGVSCETDINECASSPCQNGGTCSHGLNFFTCACPGGYSGSKCQTDINECASSPCRNGGTCTDTFNGYVCTCPAAYADPNCGTDVNECAISNGGCDPHVTCFNTLGSRSCGACPSGFVGDGLAGCVNTSSVCVSYPCQNGGTCTDNNDDTFTCTCSDTGYGGTLCQTDVNECATLNGGCDTNSNCTNTDGSRTCSECPEGYVGTGATVCLLATSPCVSAPCQNGGTCDVSGGGGYTCACPVGLAGSQCQTDDENECDTDNGGCDTHTICVNTVGSRVCGQCPIGYAGTGLTGCTATACLSSPCLNAGTCVANDYVGFTCYCGGGFSGRVCQSNINECASTPCRNGGTCTDGTNGFTCTCPSAYAGATCANFATCASSPCQNGGTCIGSLTSYTCICAAGFSAARCQFNILECASNPCRNGATCVDDVNGYSCSCAAGWSGPSCQTDVNECASGPCQNGATCTDRHLGYNCTCSDVFSGTHCETGIGVCTSLPCANGGYCLENPDDNTTYVCTCIPGYSGDVCQTDIDECISSPCLNGGVCSDSVNGFTCDCTDTYSEGALCESNVCNDPENPCLHESLCTLLNATAFNCTCHDGFEGDTCGVISDDIPIGLSLPAVPKAMITTITLASVAVFSLEFISWLGFATKAATLI